MTSRSDRAGLGNPPNGNAPRPSGACRVLLIGDVIGKPGRVALEQSLPGLRDERGIDFVTANGENLAGGMGLTISTAEALFAVGVDVITSGNHIWDKREIYPFLDQSDLGMTGPVYSVIGLNPATVLPRFLTGLPTRFEVGEGAVIFNAAQIDVDPQTGRALAIERVQRLWEA